MHRQASDRSQHGGAARSANNAQVAREGTAAATDSQATTQSLARQQTADSASEPMTPVAQHREVRDASPVTPALQHDAGAVSSTAAPVAPPATPARNHSRDRGTPAPAASSCNRCGQRRTAEAQADLLGTSAARFYQVQFADEGDGELITRLAPVPKDFECPLTHELMHDPVMTCDGHVYERWAIEQWFRQGRRASPLTNLELETTQLVSLRPLQRAIETYLQLRPELGSRERDRRAWESSAKRLQEEMLDQKDMLQGAQEEVAMLRRQLAERERLLRSLCMQPSLRLKTCLERAFEGGEMTPDSQETLKVELRRAEGEAIALAEMIERAHNAMDLGLTRESAQNEPVTRAWSGFVGMQQKPSHRTLLANEDIVEAEDTTTATKSCRACTPVCGPFPSFFGMDSGVVVQPPSSASRAPPADVCTPPKQPAFSSPSSFSDSLSPSSSSSAVLPPVPSPQAGCAVARAQERRQEQQFLAACERGDAQEVRLLLQHGVLPDCTDQYGNTGLVVAAFAGHLQTTQTLLAAGASVDIQAADGVSALMQASLCGHTEVSRCLLSADANVHLQATNGVSALMRASLSGHTTIVRLLVERKAELDMHAADGVTALMRAALNGHTQVARKLLEAKASLEAKDNCGRTASDYAAQRGQQEMLQLLAPSSPSAR
eukprot:TRINITY_DN62750_c0_g2_i1.p1 TRINITY_DN62750_c0_g2~~TRINITY_DN62750_c0_g2_i1.p1  ORF type:complete len:663 (-),score=133.68 TRINITY_DN62750_c0_g2_i1:176-2164(-)